MEAIILISEQKWEPPSQTNIGESFNGNKSTIPGCGATKRPQGRSTYREWEWRWGGWVDGEGDL